MQEGFVLLQCPKCGQPPVKGFRLCKKCRRNQK